MSRTFIETSRLLLRELADSDLQDFFRLESDRVVQEHVTGLTNSTISTVEHAEDVLHSIIRQYTEHGTGRMAVIEKASGLFIGLAGIKWHDETVNDHSSFYELGYRLLPQYWGKGYATEAGKAAYDHCVSLFAPPKIYAYVHVGNQGSVNVLTKLNL